LRLLEEVGVLDGQGDVVREGGQDRELLVGEDPARLRAQGQRPEHLAPGDQRDGGDRPVALVLEAPARPLRQRDSGIGKGIGGPDRSALGDGQAGESHTGLEGAADPLGGIPLTCRSHTEQIARGGLDTVENRAADPEEIEHGGDQPVDALGEVERPHQLAAHADEGAGGLLRALELGQTRAQRLHLGPQLGVALRWHDVTPPPWSGHPLRVTFIVLQIRRLRTRFFVVGPPLDIV
jgi:hypothetical protein